MTRRIIAIVLVVLGLGTAGAAVASATVWKPDSVVTVPLPQQPEEAYVVTAPGVLNIVNSEVGIRAVAQDPESPVFLGVGRTADVDAWVEQSDHGRITDLETWEELTYVTVPAVAPDVEEDVEEEESAEGAEVEEPLGANPAESDMWVEQVNGVGEVTYSWSEVQGNWSMIFATDGTDPAPMVELTWEREVPTPALIPGIILGSLLTLVGLILFGLELVAVRRGREQDGIDEVEEDDTPDQTPEGLPATPEEIMAGVEAAAESAAPVLSTGEFERSLEEPEVDSSYPHDLTDGAAAEGEEELSPEGRPLTRREIRERERARERAESLGGAEDEAEADRWPSQGEQVEGAEARPKERRRWWQRKPERVEPITPVGPIILDEDTGEIIITGEIDLSSLNPRATADSWRATWGLDQDTKTRWRPLTAPTEEGTGDQEDE